MRDAFRPLPHRDHRNPLGKSRTRAHAGHRNYIYVYDVYQDSEDKATVPIYYESRLAKLELKKLAP
jgi:type I restriction enzyme R subunit